MNELNISKNKYFLVSIHREENLDSKNFDLIVKIINKIESKYDLPIIFSTHPRTKNGIKIPIMNLIRILNL